MFKWFKKTEIANRKDKVQQMTSRVLTLPETEIVAVREFALHGWELGETHGLSHWQRVEHNGILLSTEVCAGVMHIREDINIRVVRMFAYLHDKCRLNNEADLEHGIRTANMLSSIRNTILQNLSDEEFSLLEQACRLHTTTHKTGNLTIDTCFDADRLDLERVGIIPFHNKMATQNGRYWAIHLDEFHQIMQDYE